MPDNLILGDCNEVMDRLIREGVQVDAIVTDPPYGLSNKHNSRSPQYGEGGKKHYGEKAGGFMGMRWDADVPDVATWEKALRLLKPGRHLMAFAGTRTQHRMACRIEDAGFEIRDMIAWVYGSGFPKSLDVSKAIDKMKGADRGPGIPGPFTEKRTPGNGSPCYGKGVRAADTARITSPATEAAKKWEGWGTGLKPAMEPITLARRPLEAPTVAANVLQYGTGGINVDAGRIATEGEIPPPYTVGKKQGSGKSINPKFTRENQTARAAAGENPRYNKQGRWPANLIHDGSPEVLDLFPFSKSTGGINTGQTRSIYSGGGGGIGANAGGLGDAGSAARFFYCAKASGRERNSGPLDNTHPTVKPISLMLYLVRLITPPGGLVLDPFMGSGSTGLACKSAGFRFIGIEKDPAYFNIARGRLEAEPDQMELL